MLDTWSGSNTFAFTVRFSVFAGSRLPFVNVTGLPLWTATVKAVLFAGSALIPLLAKSSNLTSLVFPKLSVKVTSSPSKTKESPSIYSNFVGCVLTSIFVTWSGSKAFAVTVIVLVTAGSRSPFLTVIAVALLSKANFAPFFGFVVISYAPKFDNGTSCVFPKLSFKVTTRPSKTSESPSIYSNFVGWVLTSISTTLLGSNSLSFTFNTFLVSAFKLSKLILIFLPLCSLIFNSISLA